jgi:hypothetical protein
VILFLLLQLLPIQANKSIPATSLSVPAALGTTHAKVIWTDKNGNSGVSILTDAQYAAIGNGAPPKPVSFSGTAQDWIDTWQGKNGAHAIAIGGRRDVNTGSKEHGLGTVEAMGGGRFRIYLGDPDLDGFLILTAQDIVSGSMPNIIITPKCGLVTGVAGQISGNVDLACAKGTR